MGLALTSVAYVIPYHQLASMAKPTYAYDGDLLDGGFDMSTGGICGYGLSHLHLVFLSFSIHGFVMLLYATWLI